MQATQPLYVKTEFQKSVSRWLLLCLILIGLMVAVGGYTRLTGSGLSITEWKPIHGTIPPLNIEQWNEEFEKYQAIPQYQKLNIGMSLEEFKEIYWPEYWHRNLGRLIGIVYALPMFFYMFRKAFIGTFNVRLLIILGLGGLQGLIGWIMVASGLSERLYVSHIKLALHFGTAMLLAAAVFWTWLDVKHQQINLTKNKSHSYIFLSAITLFIFIQLIMGGLVAGLHAGLIYNTFPTMNGSWIAPDVFVYEGSWFDHVPMLQFIHRWLAKAIVLAALLWWFLYRKSMTKSEQQASYALLTVMAAQFLLGILTLINVVPLGYALLHQIGGFLLLLASLNALFYAKMHNNRAIQVNETAL